MLSVILPAYNEEKMIRKAADTVGEILAQEKIPYELVFVNDGSKDATWDEIEKTAAANEHITGVNFSRNFGKEAAMLAGLANASGDCCAVMDCDLQHPPQTLVEMYRLMAAGLRGRRRREAHARKGERISPCKRRAVLQAYIQRGKDRYVKGIGL